MNKKYYWIILLAVITIGIMYASGMSKFYFGEMYDIGFDQYLDVRAGIMFVSLLSIGFIIGIFVFKKK